MQGFPVLGKVELVFLLMNSTVQEQHANAMLCSSANSSHGSFPLDALQQQFHLLYWVILHNTPSSDPMVTLSAPEDVDCCVASASLGWITRDIRYLYLFSPEVTNENDEQGVLGAQWHSSCIKPLWLSIAHKKVSARRWGSWMFSRTIVDAAMVVCCQQAPQKNYNNDCGTDRLGCTTNFFLQTSLENRNWLTSHSPNIKF